MSPWALNRLIRAVSRGAVFGYPTDTIWGLGCHPLIASSVSRVLQIKNRRVDKGLILLSSEVEFCRAYIDVDEAGLEVITQTTNHPTTWLVPASDLCPAWIRGNHPTVAIRICSHPLIQTLCDGLESPLVSTSANRSGCSNARNRIQMQKQFARELDAIIGGFSTGGIAASEIKSFDSGDSIRQLSC
jgi:L-threonylcarbamoyladenylate synthase